MFTRICGVAICSLGLLLLGVSSAQAALSYRFIQAETGLDLAELTFAIDPSLGSPQSPSSLSITFTGQGVLDFPAGIYAYDPLPVFLFTADAFGLTEGVALTPLNGGVGVRTEASLDAGGDTLSKYVNEASSEPVLGDWLPVASSSVPEPASLLVWSILAGAVGVCWHFKRQSAGQLD